MKERVLFLCTGNSARSQMAEAFLRQLAGDRFEVASAGTHPAGLNADAVAVMHELGTDISKHRSKSVDYFLTDKFDYVITVCDNVKESCPVFPGNTQRLHWSFEDPAAAKGTAEARRIVFRRVRDQIKAPIQQFLHRECSREVMP